MSKDAVIKGITNWNATPTDLATAHAAISGRHGTLGIQAAGGEGVPLADAPRAHDAAKPGAYGKITC